VILDSVPGKNKISEKIEVFDGLDAVPRKTTEARQTRIEFSSYRYQICFAFYSAEAKKEEGFMWPAREEIQYPDRSSSQSRRTVY
jgi:hypothetical protein